MECNKPVHYINPLMCVYFTNRTALDVLTRRWLQKPSEATLFEITRLFKISSKDNSDRSSSVLRVGLAQQPLTPMCASPCPSLSVTVDRCTWQLCIEVPHVPHECMGSIFPLTPPWEICVTAWLNYVALTGKFLVAFEIPHFMVTILSLLWYEWYANYQALTVTFLLVKRQQPLNL